MKVVLVWALLPVLVSHHSGLVAMRAGYVAPPGPWGPWGLEMSEVSGAAEVPEGRGGCGLLDCPEGPLPELH